MTAAANLRTVWNRISRLDLLALLVALAGGLAYLSDAEGALFNYLKFIALLAALYLGFVVRRQECVKSYYSLWS